MNIIGWCLFGLIAGAVARGLIPGHDKMGCFATIGLGIGGSFTGGFLANKLFGAGGDQWQPAGFIGAVIGAILLLWLYRLFCGKSKKL